tara:strand:+ start:962 stop:1759 length:798 start_codon:yes stop_codon:yes gene_type:complete
MDPKAPRLATATLALGTITLILCLVSFVLKLGLADGFGTEEIILLIIGGLLLLTSFLASRERTEILMIESMTVEEQFEAMESMPSTFISTTTEVDQFGFETKPPVSTDSQGIVASILGQTESVNPEDINSAMAALTSGNSGSIGAESVRNNPAPHAHTEQFREVFKSSSTTQEGFERMKVENIPLPGQKEVRSTPDLPWVTSKHEFQTTGIEHIPLPGATQIPETESPQVVVSGMPDLDDLFEADNKGKSGESTLPTLPNLDDLF